MVGIMRSSIMSRRLLCLLALLFVADSMAVNGRGPRPITLAGKDVLEVTRLVRLQAPALA
jgi:hypothetical protein